MTFIEIAKPSKLERFLILLAQISFGIFYTLLYMFFKKTAHRMIGYFEEEAVMSYSEYLAEIDNGKILNRPAPQIAIEYWSLGSEATLRDVIIAVRADEAGHLPGGQDWAVPGVGGQPQRRAGHRGQGEAQPLLHERELGPVRGRRRHGGPAHHCGRAQSAGTGGAL